MPFPGLPPAIPGGEPDRRLRARVRGPGRGGPGGASSSTSAPRRACSLVRAERARGRHQQGLPPRRRVRRHRRARPAGVEHRLGSTVVKWSDATYVEDQDQWWHGGHHPVGVPLRHRPGPPRRRPGDRRRSAATCATGTLELRVEVAFAGRRTRARLDRRGGGPRADRPPGGARASRRAPRRAAPQPPTAASSPTGRSPGCRSPRRSRPRTGRGSTGSSRRPRRRGRLCGPTCRDVRPWSAEVPHLYPLTVVLRSPAGAVVEQVDLRIGFRRVEIVGLDLLLNGRRVFIRGVNRHDFDRDTGRVISGESMRADLVLMKRFGFNAVRTSHYPNDPAFLDLCDELGLYVIDEADIEAHAFIELALRRPALPVAVGRAGRPHGPAGQEPPLASSSGRSATSPATARTTTPPPAGCAATTRPARSTTRARSSSDWASDQTASAT